MNEAGLVIALMGLDATQYPPVDSRPSTGILDWIQYQLDVSATVDDVVAHAQQIRIAQGGKGLHYLIADRGGRALTVEYLSGLLITHQDSTLPFAVLTNNTYDEEDRIETALHPESDACTAIPRRRAARH
jgi:choloylglycine hydrolase